MRILFNSSHNFGQLPQEMGHISREVHAIEKIVIYGDGAIQSHDMMPPQARHEEHLARLQDAFKCSGIPEKGKFIEVGGIRIYLSFVERGGIFGREQHTLFSSHYLGQIGVRFQKILMQIGCGPGRPQ